MTASAVGSPLAEISRVARNVYLVVLRRSSRAAWTPHAARRSVEWMLFITCAITVLRSDLPGAFCRGELLASLVIAPCSPTTGAEILSRR